MNEIEAVGAASASGSDTGAAGKDRPWLFAFLIAPSAVVANGVIQGGVLAFLLDQQGIGPSLQSHLLFLLGLPTWLYFLWSPITDFFVKRRTWLVTGSVLSGSFMLLAFRQQHLLSPGAKALMLLSACCSQLVVSSCGGMMGAMSTQRVKTAASGFYQGGGLGFGALATWALIHMSSRASSSVLGVMCAAMAILPALVAFAAPEQQEFAQGTYGEALSRMWSEFRATFFRWEAIPYLAVFLFPMASGAAVGLIPGMAKQYGVNGDSVAWINGLGGAVLMGAGALLAGAIRVRGSRVVVVYMTLALLNAAALGVLWLGPMRPSTYATGVVAYLFTIGGCYAMFTAVLLAFMGHSGLSGSTRYSIINSLGNVPVQYMILLDGWGGGRWGGRGLAGTEVVVGGVGAVILLIYFLARKQFWESDVVAAEA